MTTYQVSSQWHIIDNRLSWLMDNDTTQEHRSQLIAGIRKDLQELWERYETNIPPVATRIPPILKPQASPQSRGFTGNFCEDCGEANMIRNGTCEVCADCGATTGCS
ncbi:hypothetical protein LCGC14_1833160 [marine sediment metagenome]|uniref:Uncharacterized protein n=1 Tax=marine sediment metagenome TaxID=412755 RepID=A0A0F9GFN4_9ZZZZ